MCNPVLPLISPRTSLLEGQRWLVMRAVEILTEHAGTDMAANTAAADTDGVARSGGAAANGGSIKRCVCSPTRHPGSFRCRYHHVDYAWGRRITKK